MSLGGEQNQAWTAAEVERTVAAYFEMWRGLLVNQGTSKRAQIVSLQGELGIRSRQAIEYKFRNISSVVQERRDEWQPGYLPLANIQASLREAVDAYLTDHGELVALIEAHNANVIPGPTPDDATTDDVLVPPPSVDQRPSREGGVASGPRSALRDFQRREIGRSGEAWVLDLERALLKRAGREELSAQVRWTAKLDGDGYGYDIHSFRPDGRPRLIEVKTTNKGITTPFFISTHEVQVSRDRADEYSLYRVFDFRVRPKLYRLDGSVEESARLETSVFVGLPK